MENRQVLALGFFDGVHLGHGALLRSCRELADKLGVKAGAVTFSVHPDALVAGKAPGLINTEEDRLRLMKTLYGMDSVTLLPFDRAMMQLPWQHFLKMLVSKYGAAGLVCGGDFRFGNRGEGNCERLQEFCREFGLPCEIIPEQDLEGIRISSTRIRELIEQGDMETAEKFLGHPHIFSGEVVPGRQLGRTIGIPTANLLLPEELAIPRLGVYACKALVDGREYLAVTNIGSRPTVHGHQVRAESWLLDFEGDLYGKWLTLTFYEFLRPEKKFSDLEELRREILENAAKTRKLLGKR
ncbi:MAG: bifunctional riboflavin kinase/FAD synthetase [Oscillospiraceae bacterium]|nr:bifunctional riboflavin kinase/FAD synthetase [Oscillospiraceae bacterium]